MARSPRERSLQLDVESLRVFRELVAQDGFTAASRTLGITQPAVSLKIRRLEDRLGISLILRDGHSFTLTAHGRDLLAHADEIVEAHDRAVDHMRRSELSGSVRLGCSGAVGAGELSEVVNRFRRTHPDIDLAIRVDASPTISEMLDDGEIDVALVQLVETGDAVRPTDLVWRREQLHIVHGLAVDFVDKDPVPLVTFGPRSPYYPQLMAAVEASGRSYRFALLWPSIKGVQDAIEAGLGVGILNTSHVTDGMRPWQGVASVDLPQVAFVLRSRAGSDGDELIAALETHLAEVLTSSVA